MKPLPQQQKTTDARPRLKTMRLLPVGYPLGVSSVALAMSFMPLLDSCSSLIAWTMLHAARPSLVLLLGLRSVSAGIWNPWCWRWASGYLDFGRLRLAAILLRIDFMLFLSWGSVLQEDVFGTEWCVCVIMRWCMRYVFIKVNDGCMAEALNWVDGGELMDICGTRLGWPLMSL